MTTRFNPPPGWPLAGLGALPRADWRPDPGIPAAPSDWPFYVDDRGYVTTPPIGVWQPPLDVAPVEVTPVEVTPGDMAPVDVTPVDVATVAVTPAGEPPAPAVAGRHRRPRRRPRWSRLFVALSVTATSVVVVLLGVLAALR